MNICVIPARIGSKRIKNKNIINFFGKPLISHVIKEIKKAKVFKEIVVSTDSEKIKKITKEHGAKIYFDKPKKLCSDTTTTFEIIKHCIDFLKKKKKLNYICCIYPTAVLLDSKHIKKSLQMMKKKKNGFVFSVQQYEHPIERAISINRNEIKILKKKYAKTQSNYLKKYFYDAGQFYWGKIDDWLKSETIFNKRSSIYQLNRYEAVDINVKDDLKLAKILFKNRKKY